MLEERPPAASRRMGAGYIRWFEIREDVLLAMRKYVFRSMF